MGKGRLEAFSDGVMAIIITIMVLEMKVPHTEHGEPGLNDLKSIAPVFISYILSFVYVGIYWNNHHHMMHAVKKVNGTVLWANIHLLFWLSLIPFVTGWMGENHFAQWPMILYGFVLAMSGVAYYILAHCLMALHGKNSALEEAFGKDWKGIVSVIVYLVGIGCSFIDPMIALGLYVAVACLWFIPDRRIEKVIAKEPDKAE